MTTRDIFYIVASIGIALVVAGLLPVLLQLKRTVQKAEITLDQINKDLGPYLRMVTEASNELHSLTTALQEKIIQTDQIIDSVRQTGDTLLSTAELIKESLKPLTMQIRCISAGIAAFTGFFNKSEHSARR